MSHARLCAGLTSRHRMRVGRAAQRAQELVNAAQTISQQGGKDLNDS